jgi:hypothetical protein
MNYTKIVELVRNPTPGKSGVKRISVVDEAAIMEDAIYFNKQTPQRVTFANEEKGIIISPVLIPNRYIPRIDEKTKEMFAVFMSRETIFETAYNWMKEGRQNFADQMHDQNEVDGITYFQSFLSDENFIPNPKGWDHLPFGTWYVMAKLENEEVKQKFRDGIYKGLSIDGLFDQMEHKPIPTNQMDAIIYDLLND